MIEKVGYLIEYGGYRLVSFVLRLPSLPTHWGLAKILAWLNIRVFKIRTRVVEKNVTEAFKNWTHCQRIDFIKDYWVHQIFFFLDMATTQSSHFPLLNKRVSHKMGRVEWPRSEISSMKAAFSQTFKNSGKGIFLAGHFGNFILATRYVNFNVCPIVGIVKRQKNYLIHRHFYKKFQDEKLLVLESRSHLKDILTLNYPEPYWMGIMFDQRAGRSGLMIDLLGRPASTARGCAHLIKSYNLPVMFGHMMLRPDLNYCINLVEIKFDCNLEEQELLKYFNQILETFIIKFPKEWFWVHKRWK